jgi:putative oxidoreductase
MIEKIMSAGSWGRSAPARWAPIPLRLIVGYGFMEHGYAKMARGAGSFAAILDALGVPAPHLMAWVSILTELLGGLAVLAGAFVALASVPMAILLMVAIFTVHLPNGFSSIKLIAVTAAGPQFGPVGYEVNLLYLACLAALVLGGSGPFALDSFLQKLRKRQEAHDWASEANLRQEEGKIRAHARYFSSPIFGPGIATAPSTGEPGGQHSGFCSEPGRASANFSGLVVTESAGFNRRKAISEPL